VTADKLYAIQSSLRMTNARMAETLGITDRTYAYWKSGSVPIPNPAALALHMLECYRPAAAQIQEWSKK